MARFNFCIQIKSIMRNVPNLILQNSSTFCHISHPLTLRGVCVFRMYKLEDRPRVQKLLLEDETRKDKWSSTIGFNASLKKNTFRPQTQNSRNFLFVTRLL